MMRTRERALWHRLAGGRTAAEIVGEIMYRIFQILVVLAAYGLLFLLVFAVETMV